MKNKIITASTIYYMEEMIKNMYFQNFHDMEEQIRKKAKKMGINLKNYEIMVIPKIIIQYDKEGI